ARDASLAERVDVFVRCAGKEIEERVEAAVERASQLRNRAVERVQRQARVRAVGELERPFFNSLERAFRDEPNAVDKRVSRHSRIVQGGRGRRGRRGQEGQEEEGQVAWVVSALVAQAC